MGSEPMGAFVKGTVAKVPPHGQVGIVLPPKNQEVPTSIKVENPSTEDRNTVLEINPKMPVRQASQVPKAKGPDTSVQESQIYFTNRCDPNDKSALTMQPNTSLEMNNDTEHTHSELHCVTQPTDEPGHKSTTHDTHGSLRILGLNICGLVSKLNLNTLEDYIHDNFDVLCFSETKLDELDEPNIILEGYTPYYHHRSHFARKSGGIATFVNTGISPSAKMEKFSENEYIQWLHFNSNILGYELMLGTVYIPPSDSPYSSGDEFDQIMSDIIDIGAKYNNCQICLVGDFNSFNPEFL